MAMKTLLVLPLLLGLSEQQIGTNSSITDALSGGSTVNYAQLDDKFALKWWVKEEENSIYFEIQAETTGWVGLGFTKDHGMTNADIVIVGVDNDINGQSYYSDRFSTAESTPEIDAQQDYNRLVAIQSDTSMTVVVSRLLDTGDPKDIKIQNETIEVIWAMHTGDLTPTSFPQHTSRGHVKLNLLDYEGIGDGSGSDSMSSAETEDGESVSSETSESAESESSESESSMSSESSEPEPEAEG